MRETKNTLITPGTLSFYSVLCVFFLFSGISHAEDAYTQVNTFFISLDSVMASVTGKISQISSLDATDRYFIDVLNTRAEFAYLMRTNSKGKIISKVINGKAEPRTYRYIGDQTWHKTAELTRKPYYGSIVQKRGYFLFWTRTVKVRTKHGSRFGGTVAAKIDLQKCFQSVAKENKIAFRITYRNKTVFSNIGKTASGALEKQKLAVYGMPGLVIRYPSSTATAAVAATQSTVQQPRDAVAKTETQAVKKDVSPPGKKPAISPQKPGTSPAKKRAPTKVLPTKKEKGKQDRPVNFATIIIVIIVCVAIMVVCFIALKRASDKRKKLIEAIDKGEI